MKSTIIKNIGVAAFGILIGAAIIVAVNPIEHRLHRIEHKLDKALTLESELEKLTAAIPSKACHPVKKTSIKNNTVSHPPYPQKKPVIRS